MAFLNLRVAGLAALFGVMAPFTPILDAQSPVSKEYQVKAAFLLNFARFVQWPASAFQAPDAPLRIGILGDDPFGRALDQTIQGEAIGGRRISIVRSSTVDGVRDCQIVFVCKSEKNSVAGVLSRIGSGPVLTVSDVAGFAEQGGMIDFYLDGNRVRFEINPSAAKSDGLKVSAQLLGLGRIVGGAARAG